MVVLGQPADPLALSLPFALASAPPPPGSPIDKRAAAVCTCEVGPAGRDGASGSSQSRRSSRVNIGAIIFGFNGGELGARA